MTAGQLLLSWTWRPAVVGILAAALAAHLAWLRLRRPRRTLALLAAATVVAIALLSPIDALSRGTLFSAHMLQHMLLVLVAPLLVLLACPRLPAIGRTRRPPVFACWTLGVGAMWLWHAPVLCNAAARSDGVHALQTVSLVAMGAAFWWPILSPRRQHRLRELPAIAYLFTACLACTLLGASLAFSPVEVCTVYAHPADPLDALPLLRGRFGLTPAVDQMLGGLLMWVPGCTVYAGAILAMLARYHGAPTRARPGLRGV
jgi:cytochrome c oxidase assembly factor CtaG